MDAKTRKEPRSEADRGLLTPDHSEIKLVKAADREWWSRLSDSAKATFAERLRKKWTDEETIALIQADPDKTDYYQLADALHRSPGSLRARRSMMIHLLKDEYGYAGKAVLYQQDRKTHHKFADIAQVHRLLEDLGIMALPVGQQFAMARHLKQPSASWRGDHSGAVLRQRRADVGTMLDRLKERKSTGVSRGEGHGG